jgi:hypothetical protein
MRFEKGTKKFIGFVMVLFGTLIWLIISFGFIFPFTESIFGSCFLWTPEIRFCVGCVIFVPFTLFLFFGSILIINQKYE